MRKYQRFIFAYSLFIHFLTKIYNGKYIRNKILKPLEILNLTRGSMPSCHNFVFKG